MELTQQDYDERIARQAAGNGTDEDMRLIKHYEDEGFSTREDSAGRQNADESGLRQPTVTVSDGDEQTPTAARGKAGRGSVAGKS